MAQHIVRDKATGKLYDYDDETGKSTPRDATKPFAFYKQPSGEFTEEDIPNPIGRGIANLPSSLLNKGEEIVKGIPQLFTQIPNILDYINSNKEGTAPEKGMRIGRSLLNGVIDPYRPENIKNTFTQDPGTPLTDVLSILDPLIKGTGVIEATGKTAKALNPFKAESALKNPILNYFGKGIDTTAAFDIPSLGTKPSTFADAIREAKSMGFQPTMTQMGGKPTGAAIEAASPKIAEVLGTQDQAILSRLQDELANASPLSQMRSSQVRMFGSPEDVVAPTLNDAQTAFVAEQKALAGRSKLLGKSFGLDSAEEAASALANPAGQPFRDALKNDPALAKSFKQYFKDKEKFERTTSLSEVKPLLSERLYSNNASKTPPLPENITGDPTRVLRASVDSEEGAKRFLQGPGITPDHLKQNLIYDMIQSASDAKGNIDPRAIIKYLGDKGAQFRVASPGTDGGKWRAGMQRFAHVLEMRAKSGDVENLALKMGSQAGSGEMNIIGSVAAVPFGGDVMKGRAGFGAAQTITAKIKSKFLSTLLTNPDATWVMSRIAGLPKSSPSVMSNLKTLAKIAGQLNVPVKFVVNGEEYNLGSGEEK